MNSLSPAHPSRVLATIGDYPDWDAETVEVVSKKCATTMLRGISVYFAFRRGAMRMIAKFAKPRISSQFICLYSLHNHHFQTPKRYI
jgi:hypothetical protein